MTELTHYKNLAAVNTADKTEKKNKLTYLSWAHAWDAVKKVYPDANYVVQTFNGKPYLYDEKLGYMVFTEVTIEGLTHLMWLPVMDGANKAMKSEPYTYSTKYGDKSVEAASMFDINKTIMRCLVKNLAMFGLGINIYAGEDLPLGADEEAIEDVLLRISAEILGAEDESSLSNVYHKHETKLNRLKETNLAKYESMMAKFSKRKEEVKNGV